jgi:serine/threonine-protein kinase
LDLDPGTVVANRYRVTRPLGRGGMGEVFAAENVRTGRPVAVKLLRAESKTKASAIERFRREARAAGSIKSDHVTEIIDVDDDPDHGIVLVFELLEGESLIDRLKRTGPIPFDELFGLLEHVWIGLADAHRAGIVHRDLKPSNVFLERRPDGRTRVKILDFGISKLPREMGGETLTEMGQSLGTFSFMPPEQIGKAKTVDHRADIYAAATLIYQSLTGQLPYLAKNILALVEAKAKTDPRTLAEALGQPVDPRLEAFVAKGLARDPAQRFQTALEALAAWRELKIEAGPAPVRGHRGTAPLDPAAYQAAHRFAEASSPRGAAPVEDESSDADPMVRRIPARAVPEPTDSSENAATLAIPMSQIHADIAAGAQHALPPNRRPHGTVPLEAPQTRAPAPAPVPRSASDSSPYHAAPAPPREPPGYAGPSAARPPAPSYPPPPKVYNTTSENLQYQDKTQIYVGPRTPARRVGPTMPPEPVYVPPASPPVKPRSRGALWLVLGAALFALLGFGVVALALGYLETGTLRLP